MQANMQEGIAYFPGTYSYELAIFDKILLEK